MLIYHPVYDVNHGMFRLLRLLNSSPSESMPWDAYRIVDFYYVFPHLLADVGWPRAFNSRKKKYQGGASSYTRIPSPKIFIRQLRGVHETIARSLVSKGYLEPIGDVPMMLKRTQQRLPDRLTDAFVRADQDEDLVELLAVNIAAIPLAGKDGLKARTRLLEHRYEAV